MVERKHLASIFVLLMVGLAGCSSLPFMNDETPTPSNESSGEYPFGWNETGMTLSATEENNALMQEESLTVTFHRTVQLKTSSNGEFETEVNSTQIHRVNAIQERWYITSNQSVNNVTEEYYLTNGTEFNRTVLFDDNGSIETQNFGSTEQRFEKQEAFQISGGEVLALGINFTDTTKETYNGKDAIHYESSGLDNVASNSPIYSIASSSNLSSFESNLYIGEEDGEILYINATIVGERGNDDFRANISLEYTNFSSTTVTAPDWIETARNRTESNDTNVTINSQLETPTLYVAE